MKKFIVEYKKLHEYHVFEIGKNDKKLVGIFERESEAKFHADIRNGHKEKLGNI